MTPEDKARIEAEAEKFAYDIHARYHKSFTPIHRKRGYIAGATTEIDNLKMWLMERIMETKTMIDHWREQDMGATENFDEGRLAAFTQLLDKLNGK